MLRWTSLACLAFCAAVYAQTAPDPDTSQLLEDARRIALNYSKTLPDFICTEMVHRFEAQGATAAFHPTDVLTLQLTYFKMKENYKLVARNNKPAKGSLESVGGASSEGEFGSKLLLIFHPVSKAEFTFEDWSTIGDRRVAVYNYHVKRVNSHFEMRVARNTTIAGYHGEVFVDAASHMVLRIAESIDIPEGFPVQFSHNTGDYDFVEVSGQRYLLPIRFESIAADLPPLRGRGGALLAEEARKASQLRYRNVIEFQDYRKYTAESTVSFDAK